LPAHMKHTELSRKEIGLHLLTWFFVGVYFWVSLPDEWNKVTGILVSALVVTYLSIPYYALFSYLLPAYWETKKIALIPFTLGLFVLYHCLNWCHRVFLIPLLFSHEVPPTFISLLPTSLLFFPAICFIALSSYTNRLALTRLRISNQKERVLLSKELSFLKNQFDSHLTFNFLNFVYSRVHESSEEAADSIELFSNMLRYSLRIKPAEPVPLKKELDYISDFISLQKHLDPAFIDFQYNGVVAEKFILPRVLITFVENAFKHGQSNNPNYPLSIQLDAQPQFIRFIVSNRKNKEHLPAESSNGRENVQQILDLFYKDKHSLGVKEDAKNYSTELILFI
jgi:LytS/YehU family sensor histidine kinase